ncbi:hypothetical protein ABPG72_004945 [Tetrahymena utriculariae]
MNESIIVKRKKIINDQIFLDSAYQYNEGRIVVFDNAIQNFVDKLNPNIKNVIDRNYDGFVQKTQEVAVEIKKLQRQIQWEQDIFEQIEVDLDNQPVLQDLHQQIKKYNDIYHYYLKYIDVIKSHIQIEEKKLIYLRQQYSQLKCVSQQQNTIKMAGLVKYFREKLSLFQFSKSKNSSRSPNKSNSKVINSPLSIAGNSLYQTSQNINFNSNASSRKKKSLQVYENDFEFQLTDRTNLQQRNIDNVNNQLYRLDSQRQQKSKPRMIFSLKQSPNSHQQHKIIYQESRRPQTKGFYSNIKELKQEKLTLRDTQQIKMLSYTNPKQKLNSSLYLKQNSGDQQDYFGVTCQNKFDLQNSDSNYGCSIKRNSIDLGIRSKKRYEDKSALKYSSYLFTPIKNQRNLGQKISYDNKFRSTQASPSNSFQEFSLISQNSIMNSFNDNLLKQSPKILDSSQNYQSQIQDVPFQPLRKNSLNKSMISDAINPTQKKQNLKILEFDNTLLQFPILLDKSLENDKTIKLMNSKNKNEMNFHKFKNKFNQNQNYCQGQQYSQEELKLKQELNSVLKEIQIEKQKSQQIKNNILVKIKNLNKMDSFMSESFKSTSKYVEKKIDSQEFNEQFYTSKFLEIINIIQDQLKPRMGLFSQQKQIDKKQQQNLILSEEDLEKNSEKEELFINESQQNLSIQYQNSQQIFENSTDLSNNNEPRKIRSSILSVKSIIDIQKDKQIEADREEEEEQEEEIKAQINNENNISPQSSPRKQNSIFNKLHFYDFQLLKPYQIFFLLIKDENLMGKFSLESFLKRKRALQIYAQSKQF